MFGSFSLTLHITAGIGALAMGVGVLLRDPARPRNRWFVLLCAALATWNLGFAARMSPETGDDPAWTLVLMFGSCAAAPLALGFAGRLAGWSRRRRRRAVGAATIVAGALWVSTWTPFRESAAWSYTAMAVLGGICAVALVVVAQRAWTRPPGPERRALGWVAFGGTLGVVGGVSDFLPGAGMSGFPELGPIGVLTFLLIMAAVVVRHRFLDVDLFLLRAAAWFVGAAVVALIFQATLELADPTEPGERFGWLFLTALAVVAIGGPLGRVLLSGARSWLAPTDTLSTTLVTFSRSLHDADGAEAVWSTIAAAVDQLPGDARLRVRWVDDAGLFRLAFDSHRGGGLTSESSGSGQGDNDAPLPADTALAVLLRAEPAPLTARFLAQEAAESRGERARTVAAVLEQFRAADLRLVTPLMQSQRLVGWIAIAGGLPGRYLTGEVAAAFMAVGHQAADALDRIAARADARRREKLAAVGELSAGLAHEVRNPVAAIRGAAQAIGPNATDEQRDAMLEVIEEETLRLERFVGEFLDYARPHPPRREPVDLAAVAERVAAGTALRGWGITIDISVAADTPPVRVDPDQIQRVFENLVRNAWEATGAGGRLRIDIRPEGTSHVATRFEDDGPGIAPEQMRHIFTPFHTTKPGGTGLGLALIHRVVEAHGGEVRAEGRPGVGAVFTIVLATGSAP